MDWQGVPDDVIHRMELAYQEIQRRDSQAEQRAWRKDTLVQRLGLVILGLAGVLVWLVVTKHQVKAFVQTVQVTEEGRLVQLGVPQDLYAYTPPEGVYMEMVAQWVRWTRWRGDDERMTRVQWAWAYRHTCGIAHKWLKALEEKEKPFRLGSKRVAVDIKSVTKIAAPESYQVLWEEHLTEKNAPTVKTQLWTGTFTVGRITLKTMDDLLDNRLGVCITGLRVHPQSLRRSRRMHVWPLVLGVCLVTGARQASPPPRPWSRWSRTSPPGASPSWSSRSGGRRSARSPKVPAGAAEKVYDYAPGVAVEVPVALGQPLDIVLEAGEQVRQIVDGDRAPAEQGQARRWEVKEGGDGAGRGAAAACVCHRGRGRADQWRDHHHDAPDLLHHLQECGEVAGAGGALALSRRRVAARGAVPETPGPLPHPDQPRQYHVGYEIKASPATRPGLDAAPGGRRRQKTLPDLPRGHAV